jgi:hypothetical protein
MFWRTRRWALVRFTEYEISEFFDSEMGLSAEISTKSPPKKNKMSKEDSLAGIMSASVVSQHY